MDEISDLLIRGFEIDWTKIAKHSYLRRIPALAGTESLGFHKQVTFFVGENGSGKSTLLEALAIASGFNPEGGTRNYNFSTYDSHSELCQAIHLTKGYRHAKWGYFLRAESFYNVATAEEAYTRIGGIPQHFHEHSHGESFLKLIQNQFQPDSIYFLDEPEAALSPQRQLTLLLEISHCVRSGFQFLIASHSPILLGLPDAEILSFDENRLRSISYEDTDSYQVTKRFLNDRELFLHKLGINQTE